MSKRLGIRATTLYGTWRTLRVRCNTPTNKDYPRYGSRGIKICDEWNDFQKFYNWSMQNGYADNLTIDRIDNNGDYEPSNCRWVSAKLQARNRRSNTFLTYNGETHCISEWSEITGIHKDTISYRLKSGYSTKEIFEIPIHKEFVRRKV